MQQTLPALSPSSLLDSEITELMRKSFFTIIRGERVPNTDFLQLYNSIHVLLHNVDISKKDHSAIHRDLFGLVREQVFKSITESDVMKQVIMTFNDNFDVNTDTKSKSIIDLWSKSIKTVDHFIQRLFKGRQYFQNCCPLSLVLASHVFEEMCCEVALDMSEEGNSQHCSRTCSNNHEHSFNLTHLEQLKSTLQEYYQEQSKKSEELFKSFKTLTQQPIPRHKFTRSKNLIHDVQGDMGIKFAEIDGSKLTRTDIPLSKECNLVEESIAFYIDDVLTSEECEQIIEKSETQYGYRTLEHEFLKYERDNDRALISFPYFADLLWKRIKPVLEKDPHVWSELRPFGWHNEGKWQPSFINTCMRCCRYTGPCVGFIPHRDGNFVASMDQRSKFTIIIYLNDDFPDGTTDFLRAHQPATMGELVREELERGYTSEFSLKPKKGRVLLFDHVLLHQGAPIPSGFLKYIIRTDLVFTRVENPTPDLSYLQDEYYWKMLYYYKIAANYECHGFVDVSSELYERALSLRMHYPRKGTHIPSVKNLPSLSSKGSSGTNDHH
ncbi:hypothetical protein C9374_008742 [Naegleria lovaniensis]|uniref:Fe2OG dioxygenase domain-containing protein n=1 Tax=Naegleria lovaniensis TaxID=51637 RepID=A0AA88GJB3_NAELO|nr:uncharacterized protein C9374_008742 [Naegleria lovaniensis]KAG2378120.1 hypothetical protein C9374_008742 [Naegleria lovaniensis]